MKHLLRALCFFGLMLMSSGTASEDVNAQAPPLAACTTPPLQLLNSTEVGAQALPDLTFDSFGPTQGVFHVAPPPLGNDSYPGTELQPWAHIKYAASQLLEGQQAIVHAGTYTETEITTVHPGQPSNPIRLTAKPGEHVTVRADAKGKPFFVISKSRWIVEGFEIDAANSYDSAISGRPAVAISGTASSPIDHVIIRNIDAHDGSGPEAVLFTYVHDAALLESHIHGYQVWCTEIIKDGKTVPHNEDSHGVLVVDGAERILIKNNISHHNGGDSFQCELAQNGGARPKDLTVEGNQYYADVENAVDIKACVNVTVRGNKFSQYRSSPFSRDATGNNSPGGAAIVIHAGEHTGHEGILVEKNRIWDVGGGAGVQATGSIVLRRNLIFNATTATPTPIPQTCGLAQEAYPGAGMGISVSEAPSANVEIYNNTFYNIANYAIRLSEPEQDGSGGTIMRAVVANNIVRQSPIALKVLANKVSTLITSANVYSPDILQTNLGNHDLQKWKNSGYDCNSYAVPVSDLIFIDDPINNDFYTRPATNPRDNGAPATGYEFSFCEGGLDIGFLESCAGFTTVTPSPEPTPIAYRYFAATKHSLQGPFKDFFERNGDITIFGLPVTEGYSERNLDTGTTLPTQYFERARFELAPSGQVERGRIGEELLKAHGRDWRNENFGISPAGTCQGFQIDVVKRQVCGVFLQYWRSHGIDLGDPGVTSRESIGLFGLPLTQAKLEKNEDGQTVMAQWFERARFEYLPLQPNDVYLGRIGWELLHSRAP